MTTRRMLAAMVFGLVLGAPGAARAQFDFTTFDVPGAASTAVNGNSTTAIVGEFDDEDGNTHGFVFSKGVFTQIDGPGSVRTSAFFINAQGQVVGTYRDADNLGHGFVWTKGVFATFDKPDAVLTSAIGINDHGDVVGVYLDVDGNLHGFVLSKGVYMTLDALGADGTTIAQGINNAGQ